MGMKRVVDLPLKIICEVMKEFKTSVKVGVPAEDVYAALTNPFAIEIWTGSKAKMSTEEGSEFELWDGDIAGRNIKFVENKMIVQEWYFGEEEPSIVTIKLTAKSNVRTEIYVHQTNIPDEAYENIAGGWEEDYIASLCEFLEGE